MGIPREGVNMNKLELIKEKEEMINKLNEEIDNLNIEIEELKKSKEKWIPEKGEKYYIVYLDGTVTFFYFRNDDVDKAIIKHNKIFQTREECEEYKRFLSELNNYSTEFTDEEWKNNELLKYYISFSYYEKKVLVSSTCCIRYDVPVFTEKNIYEFIDKYKKQIKKFMFDEEEVKWKNLKLI